MKIFSLFFTLLFLTVLTSTTLYAADEKLKLSIKDALENPNINEKMLDIPLYWGEEKYPKVANKFGTFKASKRTNAFMKSDENACQWAFLSAILSLQNRAEKEGGDAVVNIVSNIHNKPMSSENQFECLVGSIMVNVALKGTVVKLAK